MNRKIVKGLEQLRKEYDEKGDENRERAYGNAIESVLNHDNKITTGREAMELSGIGIGIGWRIDNILGTDTVQEGDPPPKKKKPGPKPGPKKKTPTGDPKLRPKRMNTRPKIDPIKIKFIDDGKRLHHTDNGRGISRSKAESLLNAVRNECSQDTHVVLADTYRRGYEDIEELCFLLTNKIFPKSIQKTEKMIQHILYNTSLSNLFEGIQHSRSGVTIGKLKLKNGKRIPVKMVAVPASEWCFSLLCHTGPRPFWESMQRRAQTQGLNLSTKGLSTGYIMEDCKTERDIFARLDVEYVAPNYRR